MNTIRVTQRLGRGPSAARMATPGRNQEGLGVDLPDIPVQQVRRRNENRHASPLAVNPVPNLTSFPPHLPELPTACISTAVVNFQQCYWDIAPSVGCVRTALYMQHHTSMVFHVVLVVFRMKLE